MEVEVPPLISIFAEISDWRKARGMRYKLNSLLALLVLGILCGKKGARPISRWGQGLTTVQRKRLGIKEGRSPSPSTLCRVLWHIDVEETETAITNWAKQVHHQLVAAGLTQGVAIDGKTVRRAASLGAKDAHLLSAVSHQVRLVLAQEAVPDKTNEITSIHPLLEKLLLEGIVVTVDALLTQRKIARKIVKQRGHYIMFVKKNHPKMRWALERLFASPRHPSVPPPKTAKTVDKGHGRVEVRFIATSTALNDYLDWPGMAQVFQLTRTVRCQQTAETTEKTVYGVSSLPASEASPRQLMAHIRNHWGAIENGVHWVRDVVMKEDDSFIRKGTAPQAMAALRNLAIDFARLSGFDSVTAAIDYFSANPARVLRMIGF